MPSVSERVITAMINKNRKRLTPRHIARPEDPPPPPISEVSEIGAYYKDRSGTWQPLQIEVVHIKSGGWLEVHRNARHHQAGSQHDASTDANRNYALQAPLEILVYAAPSVDIAEYDFLRFRVHSDNRGVSYR